MIFFFFVSDGFKPLLEGDSVTKVLHDCRNESATLWFQHEILINNLFDTQVSNEHLDLVVICFCT